MRNIEHIRKHIFGMSQASFAEVAGVTQATVSRWEAGAIPKIQKLRKIRAAALAQNRPWNDEWLLEDEEACELERAS